MKLTDRINALKRSGPLGLILLFFVASVIIVLFVNFYERRQARQFAESKAMLLLDRNLATHHYFTHDLKPLLFDLLDEQISSDYFDPLWMSSTYAIRKIDSYFQNLNSSDYYFKECAVNARSPFNEADEFERAFIAETNTNPDVERRTAVRKFDGEPYLEFLRRGAVVEQTCLRCHSDAESAPQQLTARYGKELGFGRKPGEYVSAISIRIPLSEAYANTTYHSVLLSLFFVVLLLFVMVAQFLLIRERKRAAEALRESEELHRVTLGSISDAVFITDTAGNFTFICPNVDVIFGCSFKEAEALGNISKLLGEDIFVPADMESRGEICNIEREITDKNGKCHYLLVNVKQVSIKRGTHLYTCHDITERKETEKALRVSEERFRRAVTEAPFPIMIHADDGEVLQINKVWTELTGYEPEEIPTLSAWTQRAYGEREDVVKSRIDKIFSYDTRVEEGEYVISSRDGRMLTWDFSSAPLGRLPDGRRLVISIAMDVTERKETEEKIESLAKFPAENPNAILRVRRDGAILYSNRAGLALKNAWGCHRGQRLEGQWLEMVEKALNLSAVQRGEIEYQGRVFSLVFAPVVESDYVNIYGLDITDLHEAETALYWESSVNKALAHLSNVLNKPHFSFEEISDFVLAHAKRLTGSKFGFAGYIDEATGYMVSPTLTKEVWKKCRMANKDIVFKEFNGLWGWVLNERKSVLVNSPAEDPRASGTPEGHIPIERFIGAPSLAGDEVIGMLALANADRDYAERDLWLVKQLAEIYALAIKSNRSQRRLEKHQGQLRDLVSSLGLAHERSARKLAAGLHAEIIDRLNSTRQSMASLDKPEGYAPGVDSMPGVREALSDLVETTHAFASGLSCPILRQSGLAAAVESRLTEGIRKKHGIETVFENDDNCRVPDEDVEYFLFEAIKELLANTVKHARATRVKVSLKRDGDDVQVAVADDGIGFDMARIRPKTGEGTRYNLFCIGERLRHLGGDMAVDSAPGEGTTVVLKAPAKAMSG